MPNAIRDIANILSSVEEAEKRRAEKRARFLERLQDPDSAELVALVFNEAASVPTAPQNGNGHIERVPIRPLTAPKPGARTGLKEAIRNLELPHRFTSNDVVQLLNSMGFQFPDQED